MTIAEFFDDVETGISDTGSFASRLAAPIESLFGMGPLAAGVTGIFTELQQACAEVKIIVKNVEQPLVMTETVYTQIVAAVSGVIAQARNDLAEANACGMAETIEAALADVADNGVPLALSVVAPGAGPALTLGEDLLRKLITAIV